MATHSIRQFPLHFPFRALPCVITFQLESTNTDMYENRELDLRSQLKTAIRVFRFSSILICVTKAAYVTFTLLSLGSGSSSGLLVLQAAEKNI